MLRDRKALPLRYASAKKSAYKTKNVIPDLVPTLSNGRQQMLKMMTMMWLIFS